MGQPRMDKPEILATLAGRGRDKQIKNTTRYVLETTMHKQIHTHPVC